MRSPQSSSPDELSPVQRFITRLVPESVARSMEQSSRRWMIQCRCSYERSVWQLGGIRWLAKGEPRRYASCPSCGQQSWHRTYYREE